MPIGSIQNFNRHHRLCQLTLWTICSKNKNVIWVRTVHTSEYTNSVWPPSLFLCSTFADVSFCVAKGFKTIYGIQLWISSKMKVSHGKSPNLRGKPTENLGGCGLALSQNYSVQGAAMCNCCRAEFGHVTCGDAMPQHANIILFATRCYLSPKGKHWVRNPVTLFQANFSPGPVIQYKF